MSTIAIPNPAGIKNPGGASLASGPASAFYWLKNQPLRRLGFLALLAYVFIKFGLVHEFVAAKTGIDTRMILLSTGVAVLAAIFGGTAKRLLKSRIGVLILLFSVWMVLAIPTSVWRGGSTTFVFTFYWRTIFPMFLAMVVLPVGLLNLRSALLAASWGAVVASLIGRTFSNAGGGGRAELDFGSIKNSGDLAAFFMVSIPFLLFLFQNSKNWAVKLLVVVLFFSNLQLVLATAARSALVAFAVALVFVMIWGSGKLRAFILFLALVGAPLASVVLPSSVLNRLASLAGETGTEEAMEAEGSKEARRAVALRALKYTFQRPIFGVGPNVFQDYDAQVTLSSGARRAQWQETHNGYLQVSVELGIPALLFKVGALVSAFLLLRRTYVNSRKVPELALLSSCSFCLMGSLVMAMVFELFLSQGYAFWTFCVLGLTAALEFSLREDPWLAGYGKLLRIGNYYGGVPLTASPAAPSLPAQSPVQNPMSQAMANPRLSEAPTAKFGGRLRILR